MINHTATPITNFIFYPKLRGNVFRRTVKHFIGLQLNDKQRHQYLMALNDNLINVKLKSRNVFFFFFFFTDVGDAMLCLGASTKSLSWTEKKWELLAHAGVLEQLNGGEI